MSDSQSVFSFKELIPITQFNRGQASKIFDKLRSLPRLIVLKNNKPSAVIISPEEYERLSEVEENYALFTEAIKRLDKAKNSDYISAQQVLKALNLSQKDIDETEDVEIEWTGNWFIYQKL